MLQFIFCRQRFDVNGNDIYQITLADGAYECYKERKLQVLQVLVEGNEEANHDTLRVEKYVMVGMWWIQENSSERPSMKKVIHMLEGAVQVPIPPDPESLISSI